MEVHAFFDDATFTLTYVAYDPESRDAIIIDPVLNLDMLGFQTSTRGARALLAHVESHELNVQWILETHVHADHLTAAPFLADRLDAKVAIGERIREVQSTFKEILDLGDEFPADGSQFDRLLGDGDTLVAGTLTVRVISTPGHTPACCSYLIGDAVFTGDVLFMEDSGTGRCDFPGGSAAALYDSVHNKLYALPPETRVFVGHDYQPGDRELRYETTIGSERINNRMLVASMSELEFVERREQRDSQLKPPRLLFPAIQVNANAGRLPEAQSNGTRYLKVPLNLFSPRDHFGSES